MAKLNQNHGRAEAASFALDAYCRAKGIDGLVSFEEALIDLLTDLRHLSPCRGVDFDSVIRISAYHFEEEEEEAEDVQQ
jgi:hypothetical protein